MRRMYLFHSDFRCALLDLYAVCLAACCERGLNQDVADSGTEVDEYVVRAELRLFDDPISESVTARDKE